VQSQIDLSHGVLVAGCKRRGQPQIVVAVVPLADRAHLVEINVLPLGGRCRTSSLHAHHRFRDNAGVIRTMTSLRSTFSVFCRNAGPIQEIAEQRNLRGVGLQVLE
jgi:hypothetical protein